MKRLIFIVLSLVVLVAAILFRNLDKSVPATDPEAVSGRALEEEPQPKPEDALAVSDPSASGMPLPQVTMTAVEYQIDPLALSREKEEPPFEVRGGAGTGRVVDRRGIVLIESSEDIRIFGAIVGPDKSKVLVKGGNAVNLVLEPSTSRRIMLPPLPPGANMFGLGDWHWIGPNRLFVSSGIQAFDYKGEPTKCCEGHNVSRTKFYTFDLVTEQLSEVIMPSAVRQPVVNVVGVMSDGYIHLMHEVPQEGVEQDLGWFKIDSAK